MIAHLQDRAAALIAHGWTRGDAEWLALVCLHSGVFLRSQYLAFIGRTNPALAHRFIRRCRTYAVEQSWNGSRLRVCRIASRTLYEVLGVEHVRHRRPAAPEVVLRRLLSLDYVLEHPHAAWLPTDDEKVNALTAAGIAKRVLPRRLYRGALGGQFKYFPHKLPVAVDAERATFVFVLVGGRDGERGPHMGLAARRLVDGAGRSRPRRRDRRRGSGPGAAGRGRAGARPLDAGATGVGCGAGGNGRPALRAGASPRGDRVDPGGGGGGEFRRPENLRRPATAPWRGCATWRRPARQGPPGRRSRPDGHGGLDGCRNGRRNADIVVQPRQGADSHATGAQTGP